MALLGNAEAYIAKRTWRYERVLSLSRDGSIWSARPFKNVIELLSPKGVRRLEITRDAEWFAPLPETAEPESGTAGPPPSPLIRGIWETGDGLLWVASAVPSPEVLRQPVPAKRKTMAERLRDSTPMEARFNTVIEAIDVKRGKVVARRQLKEMVFSALGDGFFVTYAQESSAGPILQVWRANLKKNASQEGK